MQFLVCPQPRPPNIASWCHGGKATLVLE
uniref:Uncharacterized protein n=1 Tax=Anguilla anguilla TaxID=7936 RepID=A0A0E9TNP0_ANGAN